MQNRTPDTQGSNPGKNTDVRQGTPVPGSGQGGMDRDKKKSEGMDDDRLQSDREQQSKSRDDRTKTGSQGNQGGQRTN